MAAILQVENLTKIFTLKLLGDKTVCGCQYISFSLTEGEFLGIAGKSGAGKSTILKCIYRTYLPTGGKIEYLSTAGKSVDLAQAGEQVILELRKGEIGYVSQFLQVIPRVPAIDVVASSLVEKGFSYAESLQAAEEYLARLEIPKELHNAYPATFSGGEKQRLNLARAIIRRPHLLLLDEPTSSLDTKTRRIVVGMLKELKKQGTSAILVSHDLETLSELVDVNFTMKDSKVKIA